MRQFIFGWLVGALHHGGLKRPGERRFGPLAAAAAIRLFPPAPNVARHRADGGSRWAGKKSTGRSEEDLLKYTFCGTRESSYFNLPHRPSPRSASSSVP